MEPTPHRPTRMSAKVHIVLRRQKSTTSAEKNYTTWIPSNYTFYNLFEDATKRFRISLHDLKTCRLANLHGQPCPFDGNVLEILRAAQPEEDLDANLLHVHLLVGDWDSITTTYDDDNNNDDDDNEQRRVVFVPSISSTANSPSSFRPVVIIPPPRTSETKHHATTTASSSSSTTTTRFPLHSIHSLQTPPRRRRRQPDASAVDGKVGVTTTTAPVPNSRSPVRSPPNTVPEHSLGQADELWSIFVCYSVKSSGDDLQMQERPFKKFCSDCSLHHLPTDVAVTSEQAAVVYRRHTNGAHKMTFEQFLDAIADLSVRVLHPNKGSKLI